jgi:hypothetical protein
MAARRYPLHDGQLTWCEARPAFSSHIDDAFHEEDVMRVCGRGGACHGWCVPETRKARLTNRLVEIDALKVVEPA